MSDQKKRVRFNGLYVRTGGQIETKERRGGDRRSEDYDAATDSSGSSQCSRCVTESRRDEMLSRLTPMTAEEHHKLRRDEEALELAKLKKLKQEYDDSIELSRREDLKRRTSQPKGH